MDRLALLSEGGQHDDQVLETDIMRFMAVIGMVFWIIFALIKSIPFRSPESDMQAGQLVPQSRAMELPPEARVQLPVSEDDLLVPAAMSKELILPAPHRNAALPDNRSPGTRQTGAQKIGLRLQFQSLDDLLELMKSGKIQLFGRARTRGFDLFFSGHPQGETVRFTGTDSLPQSLWEIKSGKDYAYFLSLMTKAYPAIRSFSTKQVLVHFTDTSLENRVEAIFSRMQAEEKNGILSVTRIGDVIFISRKE
jgi:hypothetical protein